MSDVDLHDFQAVARHAYYHGKKQGKENPDALMLLGAIGAAIGCQMMLSAFEKKSGQSFLESLVGPPTNKRAEGIGRG